MKKNYFQVVPGIFFLMFLFPVVSLASNTEWVSVSGSSPSAVQTSVVSTDDASTTIRFSLSGFYKTKVKTPRGEASIITVDEATKLLEAGAPDLSKIAASVIIPDHASMKTEIVSSSYTDFQNIDIAPSKGNLTRNIDPSEVAYSYGESYSQNEFYPGKISDLRKPYILRDFRGQTVVAYPFQYNPVTRTLRVYTEIVLRVTPDGKSTENVYNRTSAIDKTDATFSNIYRTHFLNSSNTYTPLPGQGNMLVICYGSFMSAMQPFVDWKNKMGQRTEIIDVAALGTVADIKTFVTDYYNINGLTFLLLVGDAAQVPTHPSPSGDSDPSYGYILGNDSYAEVIVGRFSAQNVAQVQTQVQRTLTYEMYPDPAASFYHKAVCIGSDQGPGDENEMDYEHERGIRDREMNYFFTDVDELYDGTQGGVDAAGDPVPMDLITSLNAGRSVVTYTGHGSNTSLGTTSFSSANVPALTNENMLPFIWSVACVNGNFNGPTCLAEALMRAKAANGNPTGAIATFMSTINQSWNPPMDAQDEMVDLLVETYSGFKVHTFGGLSVNGCMHMNDEYGAAGNEMTDTWTCFGDPSLMVRTNTPEPMIVTHVPTTPETMTSFTVNCSVDSALVCLSLHNQIVATGISTGGSVVFTSLVLTPDTFDVVVTDYNKIPYFGTLIVTAVPTGIQSLNNNSFDLSYFPNPAGANTTIRFNLITPAKVDMTLYNSIGQKVAELISNQIMSSGNHQLNHDFSNYENGVYYLKVRNGSEEATRKIIVQ